MARAPKTAVKKKASALSKARKIPDKASIRTRLNKPGSKPGKRQEPPVKKHSPAHKKTYASSRNR
jgi:hypothetical protein